MLKINFIGLIISTILILFLFVFIRRQTRKTELKNSFLFILFCLLIWCSGLIAQIILTNKYDISPIYFDYVVYIGTCFTPVAFLIMSIKFTKPTIKSSKTRRLSIISSIMPIICLISLWTNEFHHMFYIEYSTMLSEGIYGPFFYITSIYTYSLFALALVFLGKYIIKNIHLYFMQASLIFIGVLVPLLVNLLGLIGIIDLSIYVTPICFSITILCFALSIFKFGFLNITPIAFQKIADIMSNGYIVLNTSNNIEDCNKPLLNTFSLNKADILNVNIFDIVDMYSINKTILKNSLEKVKQSDETVVIEKYFKSIKKYFTIEINSIKNRDINIGTLILFNDITQHKLDLQTIENNQEILIERERLATLGQMIGGIAHNLKTPIMSISGAAEGVLDLVNEYKSSIGDPEVTTEDHLEIAGEMEEWIRKIQSHLSYMSDIITTVKGQAVAFNDSASFTSFAIDDLIRQVNILMKHELSHALVELEETLKIPGDTVVKGNINSLVQVVNNIISNAIQAYDGKTGQKIVLDIYKEKNLLVLKIQDFAGGLPDSVKQKLFKEMITTKGKNGTGLGLFMSYSNIKAHFNGNIRFESRKNKGTIFYVEIPNN